MPNRPSPPSLVGILDDHSERLRALERLFTVPVELDEIDTTTQAAYLWQSPRQLTNTTYSRLYADRAGRVEFCRAERSSGDGVGNATLDVLLNGVSLFVVTNLLEVPAGEFLGSEHAPDVVGNFVKGDYFQVDVVSHGGGSGPIRVWIHFVEG